MNGDYQIPRIVIERIFQPEGTSLYIEVKVYEDSPNGQFLYVLSHYPKAPSALTPYIPSHNSAPSAEEALEMALSHLRASTGEETEWVPSTPPW